MIRDDDEVKRRTGFQSLDHMLAYIIIIRNGNHDKMIEKKTRLTWLEEWFFFFEYLWGRTIIRWWDSEKVMKIDRKRTRDIFLTKLQMVKSCRLSWPRYASYDEDFVGSILTPSRLLAAYILHSYISLFFILDNFRF